MIIAVAKVIKHHGQAHRLPMLLLVLIFKAQLPKRKLHLTNISVTMAISYGTAGTYTSR